MAMTNVDIKKNAHENASSVLRRFTRRMQESGIIQTVKGNRYSSRALSKLSQKNMALKRLARRKEVERLKKLGKM
jgi:ribosomal protein S21